MGTYSYEMSEFYKDFEYFRKNLNFETVFGYLKETELKCLNF